MIGDTFNLSLSGQYCGVPFAFSMGYQQQLVDPPNVSPGEALINGWLGQDDGPWQYIRDHLSKELVLECASASWRRLSYSMFIENGMGAIETASTPSTLAAQVNVPAEFAHPDKAMGRFFLPGIPFAALDRGRFTAAYQTIWTLFCATLYQVDDTGDGGPYRFVMMPHAKYLDPQGGTTNVTAWTPFVSWQIKNIGNRRSDACTTFQASATPGAPKVPLQPPEAPPA